MLVGSWVNVGSILIYEEHWSIPWKCTKTLKNLKSWPHFEICPPLCVYVNCHSPARCSYTMTSQARYSYTMTSQARCSYTMTSQARFSYTCTLHARISYTWTLILHSLYYWCIPCFPNQAKLYFRIDTTYPKETFVFSSVYVLKSSIFFFCVWLKSFFLVVIVQDQIACCMQYR